MTKEVLMSTQGSLALFDAVMPTVIGGTLCLLALLGIKELLKEATVAFKKEAKA